MSSDNEIASGGRWGVRYSSRGDADLVWKPFHMPRINPRALRTAIYLYPTRQAAEKGEPIGGSGFIVGVRSNVFQEMAYLYAVSNHHVITSGQYGNAVIRLNTIAGNINIKERKPHEWESHPRGLDISITPIQLDEETKNISFVDERNFITEEIISKFNIGPGDDLFMVSALSTNVGKQRNAPAVRFGNLSQMPIEGEPLRGTNGIDQESFSADMRSIPGHSGSPVFLEIPRTSARYDKDEKGYLTPSEVSYIFLLGIDWSHLNYNSPVLDACMEKVDPPRFVKLNSGIAGVIPAWNIREVLYMEKFVEQRKESDNLEKRLRVDASTPSLDVIETENTSTNPRHREDFTSLLRAAAKMKPQGD